MASLDVVNHQRMLKSNGLTNFASRLARCTSSDASLSFGPSTTCCNMLTAVENSPCAHRTSATAFCAALLISTPISAQMGTKSDRYVTVSSDCCDPCRFFHTLHEDRRASIWRVRASRRLMCMSSRSDEFEDTVLSSISRALSTDFTSVGLKSLLAIGRTRVVDYSPSTEEVCFMAMHVDPSVAELFRRCSSDHIINLSEDTQGRE
jgi:hypothetical protein